MTSATVVKDFNSWKVKIRRPRDHDKPKTQKRHIDKVVNLPFISQGTAELQNVVQKKKAFERRLRNQNRKWT